MTNSTSESRYHHPVHRALVRQTARLERRIARLEGISRQYSRLRLGIVAAGVVLAFVAYQVGNETAFLLALGASAIAFVIVARYHRKLDESIGSHRLWKTIKSHHIARIRLDWADLPEPTHIPIPENHPFGSDLDLVGDRSLIHLLDTAVSCNGSRRLADWLLAADPNPEVIHQRQQLVRELSPLTVFRDKLALTSARAIDEPETRWDGAHLLDWLHTDLPGTSTPVTLRTLAPLALLNIILFVLYVLGLIPAYWILSFLVYAGIFFTRQKEVSALLTVALHLYDSASKFRAVFRYLETRRYPGDSGLRAICAPFLDGDMRPSGLFRKISRTAAAAAVQGNPFVWLIVNAIFPWDFYFAHRLNRVRDQASIYLPQWLDRWTELEALNSLANFSFLNPHYTIPQIKEGASQVLFQARQLGHPLIPETQKVNNDFSIRGVGSVTLVTGSNMAGKSTFLRTVGINLCLAYTGAPVNADALDTIPFRLFTCIRVSDSVTDGVSYFYAEVRRLKRLLTELRREDLRPVLYLIDEIFRGTNNKERLIGSRSFIRSLVDARGAGLISTHDLELVKLEDEMEDFHNYHFREEVVDGKMVFDYRLRSGPCPTTNALTIMRMEGLPVEGANVEQ